MFDVFIRRPVLSIVISIIITFLGILAFIELPIAQYPDIVPPSVSVKAKFRGADAGVVAKTVTAPLEKAINGVPGMTYMSSVSSNNGTSKIKIYFETGMDPDLAAVSVQNRVATIINELPEEVRRAGVLTEKETEGLLLYIDVVSNDEALEEKFIFNFAELNILQEVKRIEGVGEAEIMSSKDYTIRIWLKPDRMAAYNLSPADVQKAIQEQNIEAAPGKTGISSEKLPQMLQYVLRYPGRFNEPAQYEKMVIRAKKDGSIIRLKDIADVEFSSANFGRISKSDGRAAASIMVIQRPGSNAKDVIDGVKNRVAELEESFPPGMSYKITYDVSRFLDASIKKVASTLLEAFILVFIVVFLFLQDWRSTLIPALAVPVSLIGALFFMHIFGFSINLLTLFALVLAIGIVVDDAIVVVEAVHAKMEEKHLPPREATFAAMKEISGAIIAITMVMAAVFIPVTFMTGPTGIFYQQFSLTLAVAIILSGIVALTLTPALCVIMLKQHQPGEKKKGILDKFFRKFNSGFNKLTFGYKKTLTATAGRKVLTMFLLGIFFVAAYGFNSILPSGFIPEEDQGIIYVNVTTPAGATVERTEKVLDKVLKSTEGIDAIESVSSLAGYSLVSGVSGSSYGMAMISLKNWADRKESDLDIIELLKARTVTITDASIQFSTPPSISGFGNAGGFRFKVLDRSGSDNLEQTAEVTKNFLKALKERPEIQEAYTDFDPAFPQYMIHVDQDIAAQKGVTIRNAMESLQILIGGSYASTFNRFGQMYYVMLQAHPVYRTKPEDVLRLHVKNNEGQMVPLSNFIRMERIYGPEQLTRHNMYTSASINGTVAEGFSSGDAIRAIEKTASTHLPRTFSFDWSGITREEIKSGNQAIFIFLISLFLVYLLLAAQYDSFLLPMPVILSLPAGIAGAFFSLKFAGLENNIYAQVALVMLIGILGKNAILIVEMAIQRRKEGLSILQSAVEGAVSRLRPVLMTSFAFTAGLIPLCIATGAGAAGNRTIGTAAAGGMVFGTLFGLILIPGLYVIFAYLANPKEKKVSESIPDDIKLSES